MKKLDAVKYIHLINNREAGIFTWGIGIIMLCIFWYSSLNMNDESFHFYLSIVRRDFDMNSDWYKFFTYNITHDIGRPLHFFKNSLVFILICPVLEKRIGYSTPLFIIYFLGGGVAGLLTFELDTNISIMYGSSAGIASILGAMIVYGKNTKTNLWVFGNLLPKKEVPTYFIVYFWILLNVIGLFLQLSGMNTNVAYLAHLIGFFLGIILGYLYQVNNFKNILVILKSFSSNA